MNPVWIVGAGPGAPDLLTLRAARLIEQAEVLVWTDSLVNPQIAALAPPHCERIRTSTLTLEQVLELLVDRARAGRRVVRLHDGDPCLYGALAEQVCRLADSGLDVEVVPGLSAYQATAAALGRELTIPGLVQTIVLGRAGGRTGVPERESLARLAALRASLCLYLSARHVEEVQAELLRHYPADTPVAIGYRVSWPDQQITVVPLADMARVSRELSLIRTTLYVVSAALAAPQQARSRLYSASHRHLFRGGAPEDDAPPHQPPAAASAASP
ncbi:precorrin-4 C(11)-methyltransferase [Cyanobium sp. ATX 6A2]|jgi:precorrin-4/cobalt-precorrin-4 C11-methyltransferase|uniref:precorrin-4 C(11)-methyltransferase n=1 Tax=Cyanobium sp. ATX 6A2 TaxID=2823700 RepID=UPI0020CD2BC5|nr:precorrin-4 C(11)-methyltransferase [Cyanobium sp. ATX 6A2]MCP9886571.1 precorrin-4 C(11)-methyltransferase [Cyanobium sp. ATX 6A2]